jgi:serine/threonine-protein kinase
MTGDHPAVSAPLAGRYRIERELGRGGMATVYLARDLKHDRPVALKVLRPEIAATVGADRFLREIAITAQLDHPHVLTLIDSGSGRVSVLRRAVRPWRIAPGQADTREAAPPR